jgi:hypothetical protein
MRGHARGRGAATANSSSTTSHAVPSGYSISCLISANSSSWLKVLFMT